MPCGGKHQDTRFRKKLRQKLRKAEKTAESAVDIAANELAGSRKLANADGTETDNPVYLYARKELKGLRGKALNSRAEKLKEDPVMQALRSKQADTRVGAPGGKETKPKTIREV